MRIRKGRITDGRCTAKSGFFMLVAVGLFSLPVQAKYGGGTGEPNDPFLIYTAEQLNTIGANPNDLGEHFKLMADIDLSGYTGDEFNIIGTDRYNRFTGVFDGNDHEIRNFSYSSTETDYIGLFGQVGVYAQIKNLALVDPNINVASGSYGATLVGSFSGTLTNCHVRRGKVTGDDWYVGGLLGVNYGTVDKCSFSGTVRGRSTVGGLVGFNYGEITDCHAEGEVSGRSDVGGLVGRSCATEMTTSGRAIYGTISNCGTTADVLGTSLDVGGLVGTNSGTIGNSYATGDVTGSADRVGGLVGHNDGHISACYATGSVQGESQVGGLIGFHGDYGSASDCYSSSTVSATKLAGGLVGMVHGGTVNCYGTISNCYSSSRIFADTRVGGLIGEGGGSPNAVIHSFWDVETSGQSTSAGGTPKTTAEMQDPNTFIDAGWDFVGESDNGPSDIWARPSGDGYMILWSQLSPLPPLPGFSGGTGEPNNPYLISTAEELNSIGHNPRLMTAHFRLKNDIDLAGVRFFVISNYVFPFMGVLDGAGFEVSDFTYHSDTTDHVGLFRVVDGTSAHIKGLVLTRPHLYAPSSSRVGTLVGFLKYGNLSACGVKGGRVEGDSHVGGLVGCSYEGFVSQCFASSAALGNSRVGGLMGYNREGKIINCYSLGSVSGHENVGGLAGVSLHSTFSTYALILNCYSAGRVSGDVDVDGLAGSSYKTVTSSFWDIETSGQATSGGGTGLTTAQMQTQSTYTDAGWDFAAETANGSEDIWTICEATNYPRFVWQIPPGDFLCPDGVDFADYSFFASHWADANCTASDHCNGTDFDLSGMVDVNDLAAFADDWLAGIE